MAAHRLHDGLRRARNDERGSRRGAVRGRHGAARAGRPVPLGVRHDDAAHLRAPRQHRAHARRDRVAVREPGRSLAAARPVAKVTAERLLHALADGRTHSGEALAREFGITRAAIWKQVGKLADWGLTVDAAPGEGYRLARRLDLLDAAALRAALHPESVARLAKLEVFTELGSTNRHLLQAPPPTGKLDVCVAEFQTAGRGRRGRNWTTPLGAGVCLSVGWHFAAMPAELP